jgi:AraC-like DNA-binding protein
MVIDDVVLSTTRIGPLPVKPKILMPGFRFASAFSPKAVHLMITEQGSTWFMNTFNSGIIQATDDPILPNIPLSVDKNYLARLRVQNEFKGWSPWGPAQPFTLKDSLQPGTEGFGPSPHLWLSMPDKSRKPDRIRPGQWYDLHVRFDPGKRNIGTKKIEVIFNHFSDTRASFLNQGCFDEASNYYFSFVLKEKTAWFIVDPRYQPAEISKQKHEYFDDSENQYNVDLKKGLIKARIRISSKAFLGPWTLKGFTVNEKTQSSTVFQIPVIVSREEGGTAKPPIAVIIFFCSLVLVIILIIKQRKKAQPDADAAETPQPKGLVGHAINIINDNINDPDLGMEKVAEALNISRNYLSKQFKKETGQSFPEYLNNQRLQKAKDLLKNTTLSISEIAFQCGYNSLEYFNRVFKDREKCTPGDFRTR